MKCWKYVKRREVVGTDARSASSGSMGPGSLLSNEHDAPTFQSRTAGGVPLLIYLFLFNLPELTPLFGLFPIHNAVLTLHFHPRPPGHRVP
jgi:hypothetical protein